MATTEEVFLLVTFSAFSESYIYIYRESSDKEKYKGKGKSINLLSLFEISTRQDSSADKYFQYVHFFYLQKDMSLRPHS